jgi:hypothetical protein
MHSCSGVRSFSAKSENWTHRFSQDRRARWKDSHPQVRDKWRPKRETQISTKLELQQNICSSLRTRFIIVRHICTTDPSGGAGSKGFYGHEAERIYLERRHARSPHP